MNGIPTLTTPRPLAADLGELIAKPTALTPGMAEASITLWSDDRIETGLWECTAGDFTAVRDGYTEVCVILSGSVTVQAEGQEAYDLAAGDVLVMPSGWRGTWRVHEPLRKHYTIVHD